MQLKVLSLLLFWSFSGVVASAANLHASPAEKARWAIESALGESLSPQALQVLNEQIAQADDLMNRPRLQKVSSDATIYTMLACAFGTGEVMAIGGSGMACYDWSSNTTYLIGGINASLLGSPAGWAAGAGLLVSSRPDWDMIEGQYLCGNGSAAFGFLGGRGMFCGSMQSGLDKKLIFLGYQGGAVVQAGGSMLFVTKF